MDEIDFKQDTEQEKIWNEYIQWMKSKGLEKVGLTDIIVQDGETIRTEKRMASCIECKSNDWFEFCKKTGKNIGAMRLVAFYE